MMNKIFLFLTLFSLIACNGGGGSSNGGSNPNPKPPTNPNHNEVEKVFNAPSGQVVQVVLEAESYLSIDHEVNTTKGSLLGNFPNYTYQANLGSSGEDKAVLLLRKSNSTKRITIKININNIPTANDFTISVPRGDGLSFDLQGEDLDGDGLTYTIVQGPDTGTLLSLTGKRILYDASNYLGQTTIFYQVSDGKSNSNIGKVTIIISERLSNFTSPTSYTMIEDSTQAINVSMQLMNDITFTVHKAPEHGQISGTAPNFIYTPNANYFGSDSITVRATNPTNGFKDHEISLTITPVQDAPILENFTVSLLSNNDTFFLANGIDPDGDTLTYSLITQAENGVASKGWNVNSFSYSPNLDFDGLDQITIRACDNGQPIMCTEAIVSLIVVYQPKPPLAFDLGPIVVGATSPTLITLTGKFHDVENVSSRILSEPKKGILNKISEFQYEYTAYANSLPLGLNEDRDSFSFVFEEDGFDSEEAVVLIDVLYGKNMIGLRFLEGFDSIPGLEEIFHESNGLVIGQNTFREQQSEEIGLITTKQPYFALYNNTLVCPEASSNRTYQMLNILTNTYSAGENFTLNSSNYSCDSESHLITKNDNSESIYISDDLILRRVTTLDGENNLIFKNQIGIKTSSLINNNTEASLILALYDVSEKASIKTNDENIISEVIRDTVPEDFVLSGEGLNTAFYLKSSEKIINYLNENEVFDIYHKIVSTTGPDGKDNLKLFGKYYSLNGEMIHLQVLFDAWFLVRPFPDPEDERPTVINDAGAILVVGDTVIVKINQVVSSLYQLPDSDEENGEFEGDTEYLYYGASDSSSLIEIFHKKSANSGGLDD